MIAAVLSILAFATHKQHRPVAAEAFDLCHHGKYLPALNLLDTAYHSSTGDQQNAVGQFLAYFTSFVGNDDGALDLFDRLTGPQAGGGPVDPATLSDLRAEDAIQAIVKESEGRRVVILNEAHEVPVCRHFALTLAKALRREGFELFGAETFAPEIQASWKGKYPKLTAGNYTCEPEFGNLLRGVMKLGYKGFAYEATSDPKTSSTPRDEEEADNIIRRALTPYPSARIFIYCGWAHAYKVTNPDGPDIEKRMACYLKEKTGIDPLCIDQARELPHSAPNFETVEYRTLSNRITAPSVLMRPSGGYAIFGGLEGAVDLQVFHPRYGTTAGRPNWMAQEGRRPFTIPPQWTPKSGKVLIQAFLESEPADAVPVDQIILEPGKLVVPLMLPSGNYRIVVQDDSGSSRTIRKGGRV